MDRKILLWDTERQVFSEIAPDELIKTLLFEDSNDCLLFVSWMPNIKSVFLHKRKRLEIVFIDGLTYNLTNCTYLYNKLFSLRHGMEQD